MFAVRFVLCAIVLGSGIARGEAQPFTPEAQEAIAAYLRDPVANAKDFLAAPREPDDQLNPLHALLLGDAAVRVGQYRTASEFFGQVRDAGLTGAAEIGMAWASLGRGRLTDAYEHLSVANSLDPALQQVTAFAMAVVAAANGSRAGPEVLAAAEAQGDLDPALREVSPLVDAYASYWAGDAARAADLFTAFAVAHPDSRFADDAFYAAAQAKLRAGREDEAIADLQALAGDDQPQTGRLSSRLVALDGRALLREGMRRDRGRPTRLLPRRLADLLDGDGARLAQAALAGYRVRDDPNASANAEAPRGTTAHAPDPVSRDGHAAPASPGSTAKTAHPDGSPRSQLPQAPAHVTQFPWTIVLALAAAVGLLGLWLFARGGRPDHAGSR